MTINYFLSIVYLITTIAIVIEWFKKDSTRELEINLNLDPELGLYEENQVRLTKLEMKKLRTKHYLTKKEFLKMDKLNMNCSICFENVHNLRKKVIKMPKCSHIFHWKYFFI
jgi:hypothetical protein